MRFKILFLLILALPISGFSRIITVDQALNWTISNQTLVEDKLEVNMLHCTPCANDASFLYLPKYTTAIPINNNEYIRSVRITGMKTAPLDEFQIKEELKKFIGENTPDIKFAEGTERHRRKGLVSFVPVIYRNGRYEKITSFSLEIETSETSLAGNQKQLKSFGSNSVLSSGDWYKIGVTSNAVFKISYKALRDRGIDVDQIDPRTIAIYGNGGGMLPRKNSAFRYDDLQKNAIMVIGEADGVFDPQDYILFYGQSPNKWTYDAANQLFRHKVHEYSDTTYYFLTFNQGSGKRIPITNVSGPPSTTVTSFNDYQYHELDRTNLLKSGDDWFGEPFDVQTSYTFPFNFPNVINSIPGYMEIGVATASKAPSTWSVSCAGKNIQMKAGAASGAYASEFAKGNVAGTVFNPTGGVVNVNVTYNKPAGYSSSKGWLDYIEVNVRRQLTFTGDQMEFRDINTVGNAYVEFRLSNARPQTQIWDITDPLNVVRHNFTLSGTTASWTNEATKLHNYIAFNSYDSALTISDLIPNQNLHAERNYDYVIISHSRFLPAAERLKALHESEGFSVVLVTPQMIYNEFSSGVQDIVAIRDFIRMLYINGQNGGVVPSYALFMGDGSYDNKNRLSGNTNFIPTFESDNSFHAAYTYVSDDFYCMLDSNEGEFLADSFFEMLDIGLGRIPVQTLDQAQKVVDKIERYQSAQSMGDWRNTLCFVGDDQDFSVHMRQANQLATYVDSTAPEYNIEKIFLDAYKQYSTPGGQRYPDAQESIKRQVERGALIISYTGHGGEVGWAHERVLTMNEINGWTNGYNLPLFLTATCEFSRWDDPQRTAGGEVVLLNPSGGGIALLTTVRLVYSAANFALSSSFFHHVFDYTPGNPPTMGDIFKLVKNENLNANSRNFTLLGDPALKIHYPMFNVLTDSINGQHISQIDTVGALGLVTVKGHLEDNSGQKMNAFNGTLFPTVFDKRYAVETLNNDNEGAFDFTVQNKKLFKGKASVKNGEFTFQFIVPKDIAYNFDRGRISYYSENQVVDANGLSNAFVVGGTDKNAPEDKKGPEVQLFMNDEHFVNGGITDENPIFLAKIRDEHGINMAGTGIGHDISAILDGKSDQPIAMNDYYSADIDSYQSGKVAYPFEGLKAGPHVLTLKVWDVYNNSSEASIEFVVQEYKDISLNRVLNYPNPFTTNTSFFFEHNQPNTVLDVSIQIYTISGKIVNTIDKVVLTEGYSQGLNDPISWNGRDRFGDKLGRGVYIYKIQVRSRRNGTSAEKIEKLVIL